MSTTHSNIDTKYPAFFGSLKNNHYTSLAFLPAWFVPCFPVRSVIRRGLLLLQIACTICCFFAPSPTDISNTAILYTAGVLSGNLLARCVDRLYLGVLEQAFSRLIPNPSNRIYTQLNKNGMTVKPVEEDARKLRHTKKFLWAFEPLTVNRGIGWNWRVSSITMQPKHISRAKFLRSCALKYVAMYTGLYLVKISCSSILASFSQVYDPRLRAVLVSLTENEVFLYFFIVLGWAVTIYSHFALLMLPLSMACVGLKIGPDAWQNVESWPPNFGPFSSAYSIRRFWGYTWH